MQTQPQQIQVEATTPLTVTLQAQQWAVVRAALGRRKFDQIAGVIYAIEMQLGEQAQKSPEHPRPNGLDHAEAA